VLQMFDTTRSMKSPGRGVPRTQAGDTVGIIYETPSHTVHSREWHHVALTRLGEMMWKSLTVFSLLLTCSFVSAQTVQSVAIAPQGAVLVVGTSMQYSASCTYSDGTTDNCSAAGGATWTTPTNALSVTSAGVATWNASYDPHNLTYFPNGTQTAIGIVTVTAGGISDEGQLLAQSTADTFAIYTTPASNIYTDNQTGVALPINVVVGSTVTVGAGFTNINDESGQSGNPFQFACNWSSSNPAVATVTRYDLVTAVSPGSVTITCGLAGNGVYTTPANSSTSFTFDVVAPTLTTQTWYVRPDGGTPYVNSTQTPSGQCSGLVNAAYPGSGVNQPCAMGNLRYLWTDQVTSNHEQWMIGPGDTVIVAQNSAGYNTGKDARGVDEGGSTTLPVNCGDSPQCYMPTIPSGTATQHTQIFGANYANCHADSAKTQLNISWASQNGFNVRDSQFVDIACFVLTQQAQCGGSGAYNNACTNADNYGEAGIIESALTASVTYTDIFIHGLSNQGIFGATGAGVTANYLHIRGVPLAGINMDDAPWLFGNISVAGGFTMNNSITEFVGCVEENPVVHNYPFIECRDAETGGYGDGFGTASTTGNWSFDHDIWRYNFQDGLDLLHSGLQSLSVTNSSSYGNDGNAYKIGSADTVIFQNNVALENCNRIAYVIGDEPASAIVPGINYCRADGGWIVMEFGPNGTYTVQNNTFAGYGDVAFGYVCSAGGDNCSTANTTLQNNVFLGYVNTLYNDASQPAILCASVNGNCNHNPANFPANQGWTTRSNNLYYNTRSCPLSLTAGETCNALDPLLVNEPASPISVESVLDNFNFQPSSSSPLIGAGVTILNLLTDLNGTIRPNPPAIGALEYAAGTILSPSLITLAATPNPVSSGQSVTLTAAIAQVGSTPPTGSVTFFSNGNSLNSAQVTNGTATLPISTLAAGINVITATYPGDSNYAPGASITLALIVNPAPAQPTATTLSASPNTANAGAPVTMTAKVTAVLGTPTGTVSFLSNGVILGSALLDSSGTAIWQTSTIPAGTDTLVAQYTGTSSFAASNSSSALEIINPAPLTKTTTALQASSNPITEGQAVTFTATVTPTSGTPTGTVSFLSNGVAIGSASVSSPGVATLQIPSMAAGAYTISAQYVGTSTFAPSTSPAIMETVNTTSPPTPPGSPTPATHTATSLQVSSNPITEGQAITLTATVTAVSGVPTGTVSFLINGATFGSASVSSTGVATWPISSMAPGSYTFSAEYAGTSTFAASNSPTSTETVNAAPPTQPTGSAPAAGTATSLQVSPNPVPEGQTVTLTAAVIATSGTPTGTVFFFSDGILSGSASLNNQGIATYTALSLPAGTYQLTAQYSGTTNFMTSTSSGVSWTVTTPGINLALSKPSLTVTSGVPTSNSVVLTLTPVGGYSGTLQMACISPPAGTTCTFQPPSATVNSATGPVQATMIVNTSGTTTTAGLRSLEPSKPGKAPALPASIYWIPGLLAAALIGRGRKRLPPSGYLFLLLLLAGVFGTLTGCGSGVVERLSTAQTTTLKVMVTGTGNITQSINLNLTSN
jgi:hypothetical protein